MCEHRREIAIMPLFRVTCHKHGKWDGADPQEVEAEDEKAAAEKICGGPLVEVVKHGQLSAEVWPVSKPPVRKKFYGQT